MQQTHLYKGGSGLTEKDTPPAIILPLLCFFSLSISLLEAVKAFPWPPTLRGPLLIFYFHCLVLASSIVLIFLCTIFDTLNCSAFSRFYLKWNRQLPPKIYSASCCDSILTIYNNASPTSLAGPAPKNTSDLKITFGWTITLIY